MRARAGSRTSARTSCPAASSARTVACPTFPVAPVTSARIGQRCYLRAVRRLALMLSVFALAGCGGDDNGGGGSGTSGGSGSQSTDGKVLFAGACGSCHTLADAGTSGTLGPNLDDLKPDQARVEAAIKSGPGAMPENLFEGAQATTVATYVAGAAGK